MTPEKIKRYRIEAGLTQTQAAKIAQVTLRSWQRYESGEAKIPKIRWEIFVSKSKK